MRYEVHGIRNIQTTASFTTDDEAEAIRWARERAALAADTQVTINSALDLSADWDHRSFAVRHFTCRRAGDPVTDSLWRVWEHGEFIGGHEHYPLVTA